MMRKNSGIYLLYYDSLIVSLEKILLVFLKYSCSSLVAYSILSGTSLPVRVPLIVLDRVCNVAGMTSVFISNCCLLVLKSVV